MVSGIATKKISFDVACCSVRTGYSVTLPRAFLETASSGWSRRVCARQNYSLSKQSVKLFTRNQIDKHFKSGRLMRSVETQLPRLLNCSRGDYDYSSRDSETNSSTFTAEATKGKPDVYPDETDNEIELELENTTEALQATEQPPQSQWFHVGTFALVAVAFLWGTYTPVLRFLYANPGAPSPSMLTATRGILGSLILGLSSLLVRQPVLPPSDDARAPSGSQPPAEQDPEQDPAAKFEAVSRPGGPIGWLKGLMSSTTDRLWLAAAEMGTWNFLGTALQAIGLEYTTATRAAFIIQSTALFTPLISSLAGERLTQGTLMGCSAAMMGTLLVTAEHSGSPVTQAVEAASIFGDSCVLLSALFYACATVRLGMYACQFSAVRLAAAKTVMLCIISLLWLGAEVLEGVFAGGTILGSLASRWENYTDPTCWLWVVFSALGPGALATYLQTLGQSSVSPSQAQIIFSSVPLWSALLAVVVLHEQPMGFIGWAGGAFIVAGGIFVTNRSERSGV
uniref:Drug metabolite transporter superfamily n=1 Tax=Tetraselmis sp. GSL018 TaxID=582737 RepID=A0A061R8Z7_9CHLO